MGLKSIECNYMFRERGRAEREEGGGRERQGRREREEEMEK